MENGTGRFVQAGLVKVVSCGPKACSGANFKRCVVFVIMRCWRNLIGCGGLLGMGLLGMGLLGFSRGRAASFSCGSCVCPLFLFLLYWIFLLFLLFLFLSLFHFFFLS